jgi:hypothetical protein
MTTGRAGDRWRGGGSGPAIHLDRVLSSDSAKAPSEVAAELQREVGDLLDELSALGEERRAEALDEAATEAKVMARALEEVGLSSSVSEGERARREALDRDRRALARRLRAGFLGRSGEARRVARAR